ncbi:MAG: hypothetical protein RLZZ232_3268, partial [Planctomycetota bacterium]
AETAMRTIARDRVAQTDRVRPPQLCACCFSLVSMRIGNVRVPGKDQRVSEADSRHCGTCSAGVARRTGLSTGPSDRAVSSETEILRRPSLNRGKLRKKRTFEPKSAKTEPFPSSCHAGYGAIAGQKIAEIGVPAERCRLVSAPKAVFRVPEVVRDTPGSADAPSLSRASESPRTNQ